MSSGPGTYLVPVVDEVPALLAAAERVLVACGRVEDEWADRAVRVASAVDPCLLPPHAVLGPGLPVPLDCRIALRALERVAEALRAAPEPARWARGHVAFRPVLLDTADLAILGRAAAQLTLPRRSRAVARAVGSLGADGADGAEPPDDGHPAALGCLLATLVPVVDPASRRLHALASGTGGVVLDDATRAAHRDVCERVLARMRRVR